MKILITNDDGIGAEGIRTLCEYAKGLGDVTLIAPKTEQSGMSQAIQFTHPMEIKLCDTGMGIRAYSVDSTPADCVRFGLDGLKEKFDLVLSGINRGVNLGADIVYSGTVGAVLEAGRQGLPAIALSTYPDTLAEAVAQLDSVLEYFRANELLSNCPLYNVNIPPRAKGFRITRQGSPYFSDEFIRLGENLYQQTGSILPDKEPDNPELDTVALGDGYISITPLAVTRTSREAYEKLSKLNK